MKSIKVVAAVIIDKNKIYSTQRGHGDHSGGWEFPGGKVEDGETNEGALIREIREELKVNITVNDYIGTVEYDYPTFHLSMACYICHIVSGDLTLVEHTAAKWLMMDQIDSVDWLPADIIAVRLVKKHMGEYMHGTEES